MPEFTARNRRNTTFYRKNLILFLFLHSILPSFPLPLFFFLILFPFLFQKILQNACDTNNVDIVRAVLPFAKESELLALCENEKYRQVIENAQVSIKSARKN